MPKYKDNLRVKFATLQQPLKIKLARASETILDLQHELTSGPDERLQRQGSGRESTPSADRPKALDDAAWRVSRYLRTQLLINSTASQDPSQTRRATSVSSAATP